MSIGGDAFCVIFDTRGNKPREKVYTGPYSEALKLCRVPQKRGNIKCADRVLIQLLKEGLIVEDEGRYLTVAI